MGNAAPPWVTVMPWLGKALGWGYKALIECPGRIRHSSCCSGNICNGRPMKYAQTWFSSVANHCPETSLFILTKAESYFLAPDPPNFHLISRLCAVDLTHAGTARFSSRNERPAANSYHILKPCSSEGRGKRSSSAAARWLAPRHGAVAPLHAVEITFGCSVKHRI